MNHFLIFLFFFTRMATIEALTAVVSLIGNTSSSYIFYATSYTFIFAITAFLSLISLFYTIFFIPESVENAQQEVSTRLFFKQTFLPL